MDLVQGTVFMGGSSFCIFAQVDLYVETAPPLVDHWQQVPRALQMALGVDSTTLRLMMGASLSAACQCNAQTRGAKVRYVPNGSKRTMDHVVQGSSEPSIMLTLD